MKIWDLDENGSGIFPQSNPDSAQDGMNRGGPGLQTSPGQNPDRYTPYQSIGPFPIMQPTYDQGPAQNMYGPAQSMYGPAQSMYGPAQSMYGTGQSMYGPAPAMYGPAPSMYGQSQAGNYFPGMQPGNAGAPSQQPGQFGPILPADFMQPPDRGQVPTQEAAVLGPTLLQQQMMSAPKTSPQQQQQQKGDDPFVTSANAVMPMPAIGNLVTRETEKINKRNRNLYVAVLILALFILAAIIGLIVLSVKTSPPLVTEASSTTMKFTVARTDMTYGLELADSRTYSYVKTEKDFCDMISSYLKGAFTATNCRNLQFKPGSVESKMEITVLNEDKPSDKVFFYVASILVAKSDADVGTKTVEANSIMQIT